MPKLIVTTREGVETEVEGEDGLSVMEMIRNHGFDELLALCGGCCSCGTCHVYVDPSFTGTIPAMGADEDNMLDGSSHRRETSRLSCQIPFTKEISNLRVTIAPED